MSKKRNATLRVVDTNVPLVANRRVKPDPNHPVSIECIDRCIEALCFVIENKSLVVDNDNEIFIEYSNKLNPSGQPGIGDQFFKWVHDNQYGFPDSQRVTITKDGPSYREFPNHEDLQHFDPADHKFIAVALAHPENPPIYQALDSKWWGLNDAFLDAGVHVDFLCRAEVVAAHNRKSKKNTCGSRVR